MANMPHAWSIVLLFLYPKQVRFPHPNWAKGLTWTVMKKCVFFSLGCALCLWLTKSNLRFRRISCDVLISGTGFPRLIRVPYWCFVKKSMCTCVLIQNEIQTPTLHIDWGYMINLQITDMTAYKKFLANAAEAAEKARYASLSHDIMSRPWWKNTRCTKVNMIATIWIHFHEICWNATVHVPRWKYRS